MMPDLELEPAPLPPPVEINGAISNAKRLCDVPITPVDWLWEHRIPRGTVTILEGEKGHFKTGFLADTIGRLTSLRPWPFETEPAEDRKAEGVVILNKEDVIGSVIRPRMVGSGADHGRILILDEIIVGGKPARPRLPTHLQNIEEDARRIGAGLVVFDPLWHFIEFGLSDNRRLNEMIDDLERMSRRIGCAIVLVRHLTGSGTKNRKGFGGEALKAGARTVIRIEKIDNLVRRVRWTEMNCGVPPSDLYFRVPAERMLYPSIEWIAPPPEPEEAQTAPSRSPIQMSASLQPASQSGAPLGAGFPRPRPQRDRATAFLQGFLADGPRPTVEVEAAAVAEGIRERTLNEARRELGVLSLRENGRWFCELPPAEGVNVEQGGGRTLDATTAQATARIVSVAVDADDPTDLASGMVAGQSD